MATTISLKILLLFTLSIFLSSSTTTVSAIPIQELEAVLTLLRTQGHMLFANAISTSDLLFEILSLPSATLLAPPDPSVFALDMTHAPPFYLSTLRLHVIPFHLSWSNLRRLPTGHSFPTLLASHNLRLIRRRRSNDVFVVTGGTTERVEVVSPTMYYGRDLAVHGLADILTFRSRISSPPPPPPTPVSRFDATEPHSNRSVSFPPVPSFFNPYVFAVPPPVNRATVSPVPEITTDQTNRKNSTDVIPINSTDLLSPPVLASVQEEFTDDLDNFSPAESPNYLDNSPGFVYSRETSPPTKPKSKSEVTVSGEISTVG